MTNTTEVWILVAVLIALAITALVVGIREGNRIYHAEQAELQVSA